MNKSINVAIILTAYDKATRVLNEAVTNSERKMRDMKRASQELMTTGLAQVGAGVALAAPLVNFTKTAVAFEDKMADVAKVMNVAVGSGDFQQMAEQAKDLALYLGKSGEEAAGLMASLGQGGVAASDMLSVGKIAGEVGVAFGMTAEDAGTAFIKIQNALGATTEETKKITDAINMLSDSMASEASEIVNFMASGGSSVASAFRVGGRDAAAFGSTLISVGKSSSEAATIFERLAKGVFKNEDMKAIFDKAGGGAQGLVAVLEAGKNSKDQFAFFRNFGEYGSDIALLAQRSDMLKEALSGVNDETKILNSVNNEFNNRNSTTQGSLNRLMASFDVMKVELGTTFLPILLKVGKQLIEITQGITAWAKENPALTKSILAIVAGLSALLVTVGTINMVRGAFMALNTTVLANPIVAAIAAIIAIVGLLVMNWDSFMKWFDRQSGIVKYIVGVIMQPFVMLAALVKAVMKAVQGDWSGAWKIMKEAVLKFNPFTLLKNLYEGMYKLGKQLMIGLVEGIKSMLSKPIEVIAKLGEDIKSKFKSILGIQSPSKVFMQFGQHITAGATIGMKGGMDKVRGASEQLAQSVIRPMAQPAYGGGVGGSVSVNYSPVINIGAGVTNESKSEFLTMLRNHKDEIARMVKDVKERNNRTSF